MTVDFEAKKEKLRKDLTTVISEEQSIDDNFRITVVMTAFKHETGLTPMVTAEFTYIHEMGRSSPIEVLTNLHVNFSDSGGDPIIRQFVHG